MLPMRAKFSARAFHEPGRDAFHRVRNLRRKKFGRGGMRPYPELVHCLDACAKRTDATHLSGLCEFPSSVGATERARVCRVD